LFKTKASNEPTDGDLSAGGL